MLTHADACRRGTVLSWRLSSREELPSSQCIVCVFIVYIVACMRFWRVSYVVIRYFDLWPYSLSLALSLSLKTPTPFVLAVNPRKKQRNVSQKLDLN
jgi:hypothetical protein